MIIYRPHRELLVDAMKEAKEFPDFDAVIYTFRKDKFIERCCVMVLVLYSYYTTYLWICQYLVL